MNSSSGTMANHNGNRLEAFFEDALRRNCYCIDKKLEESTAGKCGNRCFNTEVVCGETIYGKKRRCDFLVSCKSGFVGMGKLLIVECKWQQSKGSIDEKFPFLVLNIARGNLPTIVLIDGGGYKPEALHWLRCQVNSREHLVAVWSMAEMQREINRGLLP